MPAGSSSVRPPTPLNTNVSCPECLSLALFLCRATRATSRLREMMTHARRPHPVTCCADQIGLPAKSGVSGIVISVVPNVMGLAAFSPRLDKFGNSVRLAPRPCCRMVLATTCKWLPWSWHGIAPSTPQQINLAGWV